MLLLEEWEKRVAGGKDILHATQAALLKFGFLYFFFSRFSFSRTPRHLCDGGYRLLSDFVFGYG